MSDDEWYRLHNCDHAHCPNDCGEHPQPRIFDGKMVCGRCLILGGQIVVMIPCRPEICS